MEHFHLNERLHTDVLEERYGPVHVAVLEHSASLRRAHLLDAQNVSRTFTITFFPEKWASEEVCAINAKIQAGGSIGKTFRRYGYAIRKNVVDVYVTEIPEWLQKKFNVDKRFAKVRLSEFYAKKQGSEPVMYGVVTEVYSPDFRPPVVNQYDESQIAATTAAFAEEGIEPEEIWRRIGLDNDYHEHEAAFARAREASVATRFQWKKDIDACLGVKGVPSNVVSRNRFTEEAPPGTNMYRLNTEDDGGRLKAGAPPKGMPAGLTLDK